MFEISAYLGTFNINEMNVYYTLFTLDENKRQDPMYIVNFKNKLDLQGKPKAKLVFNKPASQKKTTDDVFIDDEDWY